MTEHVPTVEASTTVSPGGDTVGKVTLESVSITVYRSPEDGVFVVEIDTQDSTGEIRVYVNDGPIYDADPEVRDERHEMLTEALRESWRTDENYQGDEEEGRTTPSREFYMADVVQRFQHILGTG